MSTRAVGLAGIMGGLNSEIVSDTADVVFESANFDGTTHPPALPWPWACAPRPAPSMRRAWTP